MIHRRFICTTKNSFQLCAKFPKSALKISSIFSPQQHPPAAVFGYTKKGFIVECDGRKKKSSNLIFMLFSLSLSSVYALVSQSQCSSKSSVQKENEKGEKSFSRRK
jgi:hypothetical protein